MYFKPVVKKSLACFISIVFSVVFFASYMNIRTYAFDYTQGIMFGQYYRIRNAKTNLYLTMNTTKDEENLGCSLQPYASYPPAQIFYLDKDINTSTYYLIPVSSSSQRVLSLTSSSDINNNMIVLKTKTSVDTQKWRIGRSMYGYCLQPYSGNKAMAPASLGTTTGTRIATWTYSSNICDWILEPAYTGSSVYHVLTTFSNDENGQSSTTSVNNIVNSISAMDYDAYRTDLPSVAEMRVRTSSSRFTIYHGHGNVGFMRADQKNGSFVDVFSQKLNSSQEEFDFWTQRNSYVMFITCYSAASDSSRCSLVQAAYNQGACCVTGFRNSVAGGEFYFETVVDLMENNPTMTLETAMNCADEIYPAVAQIGEDNPANTNNRMTIGLSNITLNMN